MGQGKKKTRKSKNKQFWGLPKVERFEKGKEWIALYEGDDIIKDYSKTFGLNLLNAMKELRKLGVPISGEERTRITEVVNERKRNKAARRERMKKELGLKELEDYDETFAFIAGYTSGGAPFGITHEEMEEILKDEGIKDLS